MYRFSELRIVTDEQVGTLFIMKNKYQHFYQVTKKAAFLKRNAAFYLIWRL